MTLDSKVVLVTGAGTGIGRAVAELVAEAGGRVAMVGRRAAVVQEAALTIAQRFGEGVALPIAADIGAASECQRVAALTVGELGGLDALVNNAGAAKFASIDDADPADFDRMLATNLIGPVHLIRACLGPLRKTRGSIVNVTSVGGTLAMPNRSLYGATKAAMNSLTRSLAIELAPEVRVNAVLPGPVETPIYDDLGLSSDDRGALIDRLVAATPMSRMGTPEEVARWVCHLVDDEIAGWMTGALVPVDGGRTA